MRKTALALAFLGGLVGGCAEHTSRYDPQHLWDYRGTIGFNSSDGEFCELPVLLRRGRSIDFLLSEEQTENGLQHRVVHHCEAESPDDIGNGIRPGEQFFLGIDVDGVDYGPLDLFEYQEGEDGYFNLCTGEVKTLSGEGTLETSYGDRAVEVHDGTAFIDLDRDGSVFSGDDACVVDFEDHDLELVRD